jgi:transcriptional regulator GlxA family with amidase domain
MGSEPALGKSGSSRTGELASTHKLAKDQKGKTIMSTAEGKLTVGILLFEDAEVLDFCGPFEVFSLTGRLVATGTNQGGTDTAIHVYHLAQSERPVKALGHFLVQPHYTLQNHPALDVLVIPGGWGVWAAMQQEEVVAWVRRMAERVTVMSSVCTGAFLLGQAGLLAGRKATTHWLSLERLSKEFPQTQVQTGVRWVDEGDLVTSAGISAGIDMSLHLVERLLGGETAERTARRMEYNWQENQR